MEKSNEEGYIKYHCNWQNEDCLVEKEISMINFYREKLYQRGLIGILPDGVGYGNLSERKEDKKFIISGTATGGKIELTTRDYALVTGYSFEQNKLACKGLTRASSEALTHAAIYEASPQLNTVIHVHHKQLWHNLMSKCPVTPADIHYGSTEMAYIIKKLVKANPEKGLIVMKGHEDGLICYGPDWQTTFQLIEIEFQDIASS